MINDPLLRQFAAQTEDDLAARLAEVFDIHLEADEDSHVEELKNALEQILKERLDAARGG